jgi:bifunctional DNA-binding transcriptional regulator/antitoxin component of YhaV-PrlF toxin-antitoxin module
MRATTIRLTSKRQATFPRELCEELGLEPGDELELIPRVEDGEKVWVLQRTKEPERPWLGSLKKYGEAVSNHSLESIRESIRAGRSRSEAR